MNITFDTNNLQKQDLAILQVLDVQHRERVEKLEAKIEYLLKQLEELQKENVGLRLELSKKPIIEPGMSTKDVIVKILEKTNDLLSLEDLAAKCGKQKGAVYAAINAQMKQGVIESTSTRPAKYFLKKGGNPLLHEALPKGTKVSMMR